MSRLKLKRSIKLNTVILWKVLEFLFDLRQFWLGFYVCIQSLERWVWLMLRGNKTDLRVFWERFNRPVYIRNETIYCNCYDD